MVMANNIIAMVTKANDLNSFIAIESFVVCDLVGFGFSDLVFRIVPMVFPAGGY